MLDFILTFNVDIRGFSGSNCKVTSQFIYRDAPLIAFLTVVRNLRVREEVTSLAAQLKKHQQMTRAIGDEIRTPLNTALNC